MVRFLYVPLDDLATTRQMIATAVAYRGRGTPPVVARGLRKSLGSATRCASKQALKDDCFTSQVCAYKSSSPAMPHEVADYALVAVKRGQSVGLACVTFAEKPRDVNHIFISSLCVDAQERGSGLGRDLLALVGTVFPGVPARLTVARRGVQGGDRHAQEVIDARLPRLLKLYGAAGFQEVGIVPLGGGEAIEMLASDGVRLPPPRLRMLSRGGTLREWHALRNFFTVALLMKHAPFRAFRKELARRREGARTRDTPYPTKLVARVDRFVKEHLTRLRIVR